MAAACLLIGTWKVSLADGGGEPPRKETPEVDADLATSSTRSALYAATNQPEQHARNSVTIEPLLTTDSGVGDIGVVKEVWRWQEGKAAQGRATPLPVQMRYVRRVALRPALQVAKQECQGGHTWGTIRHNSRSSKNRVRDKSCLAGVMSELVELDLA
eukprot:3198728-Amphidinium_carterae.1